MRSARPYLRARAAAMLLGSLMMCAPLTSRADYPRPTEAEWALLPDWCNWTQGAGKGLTQRYHAAVDHYGFGWTRMHHYCWALVDMGRMDRASVTARARQRLARRALSNLDYVLKGTTAEFSPRAYVLADRAKLLLRMKRSEEALATARILVQEFPKHGDGYIHMAAAMLVAGNRQEAIATIEKGEQNVADLESFRRKRAALGL